MKKTRRMMKELVDICMRMESIGNDTFMEVAGHVHWVTFKIYIGEWADYKTPAIETTIYYAGPLYDPRNTEREMKRIRKVSADLERIA